MIRHGLDDGHVVVQFSGPFSDQRGKTLQSQEQEVKTDTLRDLMPILPMILGCFRSAFLDDYDKNLNLEICFVQVAVKHSAETCSRSTS